MKLGDRSEDDRKPRRRLLLVLRPVRTQERRGVSKSRLLLVISAITVVVSLTIAGTYAAWTASDVNSPNTFTTSTILLDDNQGGQAGSATSSGTYLFNVTNLSPGSSATTACIGVDFSGTASSLTLGATLGGAGQATLQSQLTMNTAVYRTGGTTSVTAGSNTNSGSCASYPVSGSDVTVGAQAATLSSWASSGPYTIATPVNHTWYKFTVSGLPAGDTNCATYCNQTMTVALTWTLTAT